ncbi:hypothetical protein F5Y11DRAFT_351835 [Daldinia sp. FL1419]|nr:hypothetical protein F5Y11DRAFT_351835 [Daldinia sp. FL1419]
MASSTPTGTLGLLDLPAEIVVFLPEFLHNIEDCMNLSSTCRTLRICMNGASSRTILHLMDLALRHCGQSMTRIRELHALRFSRRLKLETKLEFIKYCLPDFRLSWFTSSSGPSELEGLGVIQEGSEIAEKWKPKIREWKSPR